MARNAYLFTSLPLTCELSKFAQKMGHKNGVRKKLNIYKSLNLKSPSNSAY